MAMDELVVVGDCGNSGTFPYSDRINVGSSNVYALFGSRSALFVALSAE